MFGRKRKTFRSSVTVDASAEQVWEALAAPGAQYWMVTRCELVVPVPDQPIGVGRQLCCWQRSPKGFLLPLVQEIIDFEPKRLIAFTGRQVPTVNSRLEFRLEDDGARTRVAIAWSGSRYRHEWAYRLRTSEDYVKRLGESLALALTGVTPSPSHIDRLLLSPDDASNSETQEIEVSALSEVVWALLENPDDSRVRRPDMEKQWVVMLDGQDVTVELFRRSGERLQCSLMTRNLLGDQHRLDRSVGICAEIRVLAREHDSVLWVRVGWEPRAFERITVPQGIREMLARYKAAAEGEPAGKA